MNVHLRRDSLPYILVLLVAIALFVKGGEITSMATSSDQLGPAFWPRLILVLAMCVCVFELIFRMFCELESTEGLLSTVSHSIEAAAGETAEEEKAEPNPLLLAIGVGLTVAYVWLLPTVGFALGTTLYMAAFIWLGGYRRPLVVATISLVGTTALLVLFMKVVYVSLPLGSGAFAEFSTAVLRLIGVH